MFHLRILSRLRQVFRPCVTPCKVVLPVLALGAFAMVAAGQSQHPAVQRDTGNPWQDTVQANVNTSIPSDDWIGAYVDPAQGSSSVDLVRRALASNAELAATRLEIERARSRLRQAGLRPNPSIDFEQTTGVFNSPGERNTAVGFALPIELGGKRGRRIDLAQAEFEAAQAEVADRERRLANEVRAAYAEAMAAARELEITGQLNNLDVQTARVVEARVSEGDAAPLELNLLRVEADRLRARRALVEGRLQASLLRLKSLTGIPANDLLRLREGLDSAVLPDPPSSPEAAVEIALRSRPDLRLAKLNEEVAQAGLRLARAQATPDVTAFTRYARNRSTFDQTPIGVLTDRDKLFTYGVTITLPVFNRNRGAKAEAETAIAQAGQRRQFIEAVIRAEVASAYARYQAAGRSLTAFEQGVIARSNENITAIRAAYQIGAFRVTDLLNEQRRLVDAQREYPEALAERYRALADLQAALGAAVNP
ncbi:MAG: TolC family protein [Blastocatellia bacterium]